VVTSVSTTGTAAGAVADAGAASGTSDAEKATLANKTIRVRSTTGRVWQETLLRPRVLRHERSRTRRTGAATAIIDTHRVPIAEVKKDPGTRESDMIRPLNYAPQRDVTN
jgi:hypothetical protein